MVVFNVFLRITLDFIHPSARFYPPFGYGYCASDKVESDEEAVLNKVDKKLCLPMIPIEMLPFFCLSVVVVVVVKGV
jgi:hypothetical protein